MHLSAHWGNVVATLSCSSRCPVGTLLSSCGCNSIHSTSLLFLLFKGFWGKNIQFTAACSQNAIFFSGTFPWFSRCERARWLWKTGRMWLAMPPPSAQLFSFLLEPRWRSLFYDSFSVLSSFPHRFAWGIIVPSPLERAPSWHSWYIIFNFNFFLQTMTSIQVGVVMTFVWMNYGRMVGDSTLQTVNTTGLILQVEKLSSKLSPYGPYYGW